MYRMLIVDDEERIVNSIYGLMQERFELEIYKVFSGVEAEALINRMRFDIVITDISMPQRSGLELLEIVKRRWPGCYVLLLTAYDKFDYAYLALRYERVDYLLKVESYDEICRVIAEKIELMDQERSEKERVLKLRGDLDAVSSGIRDYVLKRFIVQGIDLPEQKDMDGISLDIRLDRPALLVLGTLDTDDPLERKRVVSAIDAYLLKQLSPQAYICYSHVSAGYVFWVVQDVAQQARENEGQSVTLREIFEELPQAVEDKRGRRLALLCPDSLVAWSRMHAIFRRASGRLEQLRNESGLVVFCVEELLTDSGPSFSFPSVDEISILWELIRCGNAQALAEKLREGLAEIAQTRRMSDILPCTSVSAMTFLLSEAATLLSPELLRQPDFKRLLRAEGLGSGAQWVEDVIGAFGRIMNSRNETQKNVGRWLIEYINQYVDANYARDITLTMIADEVHYSPAYISRIYKQETGQNLLQHIVGVRIAHAKRMLTETSMKLGEIAAACGFCSTKYFNQVFRRNVGMGAGQFREENMKHT